MKRAYKLLGSFFLSIAALIIIVGPTSLTGVANEEIPNSIREQR